MLLAYMRISTREQKFDLQRDALLTAGVVERYTYCMSNVISLVASSCGYTKGEIAPRVAQ